MKTNIEMEDIKLLLGKYYEAEATPDEVERLADFFRTADTACMSDDMRVAKKLFSVMDELNPCISEDDIPEDLERKITNIMKGRDDAAVSRRMNKWLLMVRYSAIVAAALLIGVMGVRLSRIHENKTVSMYVNPVATPLSATTEDGITEFVGLVESFTHEDDDASVDDRSVFIEINDPAEARRIVTGIGKLLAQNVDKSKDAISSIEAVIESYNEITKTISQ